MGQNWPSGICISLVKMHVGNYTTEEKLLFKPLFSDSQFNALRLPQNPVAKPRNASISLKTRDWEFCGWTEHWYGCALRLVCISFSKTFQEFIFFISTQTDSSVAEYIILTRDRMQLKNQSLGSESRYYLKFCLFLFILKLPRSEKRRSVSRTETEP